MDFGLEQESGSFNYPHGTGTSSPISAETHWLDVSLPDDIGAGPYTPFIKNIPYIVATI